jgi:hypothetical protein
MRASRDPVQPMLFEKQINCLFAQILRRAFQVHRQHTKLFPRFRLEIDRQDAFAFAARRALLCRDRRDSVGLLDVNRRRLAGLGGERPAKAKFSYSDGAKRLGFVAS